ncbi:TonB-dependent receptor plug domain-containing protein [Persicobacter psychrovividus]|uniref:TonB-dependent receptor n=1 Tax=Persicobacter psychrovividus TaxID=387638 RepID=A0ABN6LD90_9BACT|nr:TonB-dependent receptor [Persicobacter psychrovividus]
MSLPFFKRPNGLVFVLTFLLILSFPSLTFGQEMFKGKVMDQEGGALPWVQIKAMNFKGLAQTDSLGRFSIQVPDELSVIKLQFYYLNVKDATFSVARDDWSKNQSFTLQLETKQLEDVRIDAQKWEEVRQQAGAVTIDARQTVNMPSVGGEFNQVIALLPGVSSNSELSSSYSVRGGSFDENLVYVNNIPIYRPMLASQGQQEGLSFVNADMVGDLTFSAGGWQSRYGDKMASVLDISYRQPKRTGGSVELGLLGGNAFFEQKINDRGGWIVSARHKRTDYLLGGLDTQGEYRPRFTDVQAFGHYRLSGDAHATDRYTDLEVLMGYANNQYSVAPTTKRTSFGTLDQMFNFLVAFDGREQMTYSTFQTGLRLIRQWNSKWRSEFIASGFLTREREYVNLQSYYRLCDVAGDNSINGCATQVGAGSDFNYARNALAGEVANLQSHHAVELNDKNSLTFGMEWSGQAFDDRVDEYQITQQADSLAINDKIDEHHVIHKFTLSTYLQHRWTPTEGLVLTTGLRSIYVQQSGELLWNPRLQASYQLPAAPEWVLRFSTGKYDQPAFYREMRRLDGSLNRNLLSQKSWHTLAGFDHVFDMWDRPFKLVSEVWFKYMTDLVPYDIDNVRLRYWGENQSWGYAAGADVFLSGEFIPGTQSWVSLGVLQTEEKIPEIGWQARPTDQRFRFGMFFQDHLPNIPTARVFVRYFYGSGLPFSPPNNLENRNSLEGRPYNRVDLGFYKVFHLGSEKAAEKDDSNTIWLGLEVLNAFGIDNVISYNWVSTNDGTQFAVPNTLTTRFWNIKIKYNF